MTCDSNKVTVILTQKKNHFLEVPNLRIWAFTINRNRLQLVKMFIKGCFPLPLETMTKCDLKIMDSSFAIACGYFGA